MRARLFVPLLAGAAAVSAAPAARAQQTAQYPLLKVGQMAPDFTLPGATRYGVLRGPVHLSAFRGKTVVLAFFLKARTPG